MAVHQPVKLKKGDRYGHLTIIREVSPMLYLCQCVCGDHIIARIDRLTGANSIKSCGCRGTMTDRFTNPIGKRFGSMTVTGRKKGGGLSRFDCICDCGNTITCTKTELYTGAVISCGCCGDETHDSVQDSMHME